ncbi:DUF4907 domain-containing protein [Arcticibacterium luteifluviistationis]|uniref:DUF4907 domain-containing protein n=1 Tax=Arcticibacterium luteifluviistationis TaxID=1784714 RepID=A0A2Z4GAG7_9BACT|nr:DUF4907 domain-containing protein [Arcticibacterium luteifluviistationis]AWV98075.1 hypothetical protein DJ013_07770 [Arcticibacterium luteifluviistationis]
MMNKSISLGIIILGLIACKPSSSYSYKVLELDKDQFGYEIRKDNQLLISQNYIPGRAGNSSFSNSKDAEKVASLMISKLENGVFPPTINLSEIDSLLTK